MQKSYKKIIFLSSVFLIFFFLRNAWSAVGYTPDDEKTFAPEPNTLTLLSSGILTMVLTFFRRTYSLTKRAIDITGSFLALILLSPLFLFSALLVKLTSKGPILYSQTRVGKDGKNFEIYKFRTMKVDAEKSTGPVWARQNDNRLIPCGKFMRRAHLDEIPQFVNVIKGDMSIIGPRPERPVFVEKFKLEISDYSKRLDVKPGITGLAQVWHHYDDTIDDVRKKIKYDILYIKRMCFWTDVLILARTVRVVFTGAGAR
jgi:exopolysaccharide biosynthesis polyprenyl glycosylphosphotransferase